MILQEYLVKLGFTADEPSLQRFLGALSKIGSKAYEVGTIAFETATAISLMVARVARNYESLYYVSQRTGQSVRNFQATQYALRDIGLSADDAKASLESIAAS